MLPSQGYKCFIRTELANIIDRINVFTVYFYAIYVYYGRLTAVLIPFHMNLQKILFDQMYFFELRKQE